MALNAWLKETFDRKRSLRGVFDAFTKRDEPWLEHVLEGIEFVGRMDIADRASNGLRLAVAHDKRDTRLTSAFGSMLKRAFDNPKLSDHNHEHSRRLERWLETMMLNIGELRHSHSIYHWIDSSILFSYWHDADQLLSLQRNDEESRDLSVKKGHALAGAVMLLALHKRYAIERKVSIHDAWEITAGAALMSLKHDEPERFMAALSGMQNAYTGKAMDRDSISKEISSKNSMRAMSSIYLPSLRGNSLNFWLESKRKAVFWSTGVFLAYCRHLKKNMPLNLKSSEITDGR